MENEVCILSIFVSLVLIILINPWRLFKSENGSTNLPPGPWKLPVIGNMHHLVGYQPHHRLTDLAKKYGPIMHLKLGQLSHVVISSPEFAKAIMKTHDLSFASRPFVLAASVIAYNRRDVAFCPYGDYWRQARKICTLELFSSNRVQSFRSIREEEVSRLVQSIASNVGAPVNLSSMLSSMSYSIISRTAFGSLWKDKDAFTPIVRQTILALGGFTIADLFPSIKLLQRISGVTSKLQKVHQQADEFLENILKECRERNKSESKEAYDLVSVLLNLQESGMLDIPLTTDDIKAVILDMFLAGYDSTPLVIEWTMAEMVKQPEILQRAQTEVRRYFHEKEKIDETGLHNLTYLNAVTKESLRLHPPGPLLIPREARETVEVCGYTIPKKTRVLVNARAIGRDPRYWTEPERFNPQRFINCSIDYKGTNFEFIPFGAGRRICPAMLFGMSVVEFALANLLFYFDWELPNKVKPQHLDMSETFGASVRRTNDLFLIPVPP